MSLFKEAAPDHPIYSSGTFVVAGVAANQSAHSTQNVDAAANDSAIDAPAASDPLIQDAQGGDVEQVRLHLKRGPETVVSVEVGHWAFAWAESEENWDVTKLLLAVWAASLPLPRPTPDDPKTGQTCLLCLEQPVAASFLEEFASDAQGELLDASNDYAGVSQSVLTVEGSNRIYLERCYGDQFSDRTVTIYAVGHEWRKTKMAQCDRAALRYILKNGCSTELRDWPGEEPAEEGEYNASEIVPSGTYEHLYRRTFPKSSR